MTETKKTLSHHITEAVRKSGETYVFYARKIEVESTTFKSWIGRNSFPFGYLDSIRILFTDLETSDQLRETFDFHIARSYSRRSTTEKKELQLSPGTVSHLQTVAQESLKEFGDILPQKESSREGSASFAQLSSDLREFIQSRERLHDTFKRLNESGFNVRGFNRLSPERQKILSDSLFLVSYNFAS